MSSSKQKPKDPLIESEAHERVFYATGVMLDAADLTCEQTYHRGRLARALAHLHGAGTAAGLEVVHTQAANPEDDELKVEPGLALDRLGRLIEVPRAACIRVGRWYEGYGRDALRFYKNAGAYNTTRPAAELPGVAVAADLFLRYLPWERGKTPSFAAGPYDATGAVVPARHRDGYELRLVPRAAPADGSGAPPKPPEGEWPDVTGGTPEERRKLLRKQIFAAWGGPRKEVLQALRGDGFLPAELKQDPTQADGDERDPAWILLARVLIEVDPVAEETGADKVKRPRRSRRVEVDNDVRPFAITSAALARWLGI